VNSNECNVLTEIPDSACWPSTSVNGRGDETRSQAFYFQNLFSYSLTVLNPIEGLKQTFMQGPLGRPVGLPRAGFGRPGWSK